jgi:hypothetical protein
MPWHLARIVTAVQMPGTWHWFVGLLYVVTPASVTPKRYPPGGTQTLARPVLSVTPVLLVGVDPLYATTVRPESGCPPPSTTVTKASVLSEKRRLSSR